MTVARVVRIRLLKLRKESSCENIGLEASRYFKWRNTEESQGKPLTVKQLLGLEANQIAMSVAWVVLYLEAMPESCIS